MLETLRQSLTPDLRGIAVLVVDDDASFVRAMTEELGGYGALVLATGRMGEARHIMAGRPLGAVLASVSLMDEGAGGLIESFKSANPDGMFFLIIDEGMDVTGPDPSELMVEDYLQKPVDALRLAHMLESGHSRALAVVDPVVESARPYFQFRSPAMRAALRDLPRIASSDQTVLITGETGTGKEIISRAIHVLSPRRGGPFVALNCGAVPEGLIEGELFGHEKGAFTGAVSLRRGKFEMAHGGTLLLDEIGDMPLMLQVRLLRVLEDNHVYRVGGEKPVPIDVRVIAATRRDLRTAIDEGLFREDLYFRLNILNIHLPELSARREDISILAVHFMDRAFAELGMPEPYPTLSSAAIELLERLRWRGNVRELRNLVTRVATLLPPTARQVLPMHIMAQLEEGQALKSPAPREVGEGVLIPRGATLAEGERIMIEAALKECGGNRTKAASMLGMGLRTLRRKLNE